MLLLCQLQVDTGLLSSYLQCAHRCTDTYNWRKHKKVMILAFVCLFSMIARICGYLFAMDIEDNDMLRNFKSH